MNSASEERLRPPQVKIRYGDKELSSGSGGVYQHVYAATGQVQAEIPLAGVTEVNAAVEAANAAFEVWRRWDAPRRRDALLRLSDLIARREDDFVRLGTLDNATPVSFGKFGVDLAVGWTSYYAGWADKIDGYVTSTYAQAKEFRYVIPQPYGVIGIIITWNAPLMSLAMKIGPALAAGNTVVVKPSEMTPFTPDLFTQLVREAGIPEGVVNTLPGNVAAGEALVRHPKVRKISFTGGPIAARKILVACAEQIKPAVLELGGKSANIIFPDADLDFACAHSTTFSIGLASGQGCILATRLLAHDSIYDEVLERVTAAVKAIKVGDPFDPSVMSGPVISQAACDRILGMVKRARESGDGKVVTGGSRLNGSLSGGFFIEPTVFAGVDPNSELAQTEVFGPVLAVMRFSTEEEAIQIANNTAYGLAAFIQSNDLKRVHRMAEELRAGNIYVNGQSFTKPNAPFGGVGLSGYGREGGKQGLEEFLFWKTVSMP